MALMHASRMACPTGAMPRQLGFARARGLSSVLRSPSKLATRAAFVAVEADDAPIAAPASPAGPAPADYAEMSYSEQYDKLFGDFAGEPLPIKMLLPKPDPAKQSEVPGAKKLLLSSVYATPKSNQIFGRKWNKTDLQYVAFMVFVHGLCLLAPMTFSWANVGLFLGTYFITGCLGITLSFHRQLSHRSFSSPKWVEYALAYCGVLAVQGDPIEWVSSHRYHHLNTDSVLDPHSPYEGFWWSHMGWLLDNQTTLERVYDRKNASDMEAQPFYTWIRDTYIWHVVAQFAALYALGGLGAVVWGGALRMCWVYHITWFVNSASHVWGYQTYNTGDQSRNNWWVGLLAFGEGWHNNHHAFEFSARHGLEWWQLDMTWLCICALEKLGLASNVKLPSEKQKARLAFPPAAAQ
ncbi:MAG: fatty acid desaturase-domain-containing protein [Monoraphidium minutum]|nr:MAG: fatty acid desaturase-domain-containing protein [Monoraphidium minutum]